MKNTAFIVLFFLAKMASFSESVPKWTALPKFTNDTIAAFAVMEGKIWAGTKKSGLFRSQNNGNSWDKMTIGALPLKGFTTMSMTGKGRIIAATSEHFLFSLNGGSNWSNAALDGNIFFQSGADTLGNMYAVYAGGVMRINQSGQLAAVGQFGDVWDARSVAVTPGGKVFAGTWEKELLRMKADGNSWEKISLTGGFMRIMHVAADDYGMIAYSDYAKNFFRSLDDGKSWKEITEGLAADSVRSLVTASDGTIIAATNKGIFSLKKNSETWQPLMELWNAKEIFDIKLTSDGTIYASTPDGLVQSSILPTGVRENFFSENNFCAEISNGALRIKFANEAQNSIRLEVFSISGQKIFSWESDLYGSEQEKVFPFPAISNGIFLLKCRIGEKFFTTKIHSIQ